MGQRPDLRPRKNSKKRRSQAELARDKLLREIEKSQARIAAAKAERAELALAVERGLMVPTARIDHFLTDMIQRFKGALAGFGQRLAPTLAGIETAEISERLDFATREVLQRLCEAAADLSAVVSRPKVKRGPGRPRKAV